MSLRYHSPFRPQHTGVHLVVRALVLLGILVGLGAAAGYLLGTGLASGFDFVTGFFDGGPA